MSNTSVGLQAHRCCIFMLLLSLASITTATPITRASSSSTSSATTTTTSTTDVDIDLGHLQQHSSDRQILGSADKCLYNLTDSSNPVQANSSRYQQLGYHQCEYIISAPDTLIILLNFTDIHSRADMPLATHVRRQHIQQAATDTTTTTSSSSLLSSPSSPSSTSLFTTASPVTSSTLSSPESVLSKTQYRKYPKGHGVSKNATDLDLKGQGLGPDLDVSSSESESERKHLSADVSGSAHSTAYTPRSGQHKVSIGEPSRPTNSPKHGVAKETVRDSAHSEQSVPRSPALTEGDPGHQLLNTDSQSLELSTSPRDLDSHGWQNLEKEEPTGHRCSLKLTIEEVERTEDSRPQEICWHKSQHHRIPLVYQYSVPVRITYTWDDLSHTGFSLHFTFLQPEDVSCLFRCSRSLCLQERQLCDGFDDCPDQSDEHRSVCTHAGQQQTQDEPHVTKVIIIVICVIFSIVIVIVVALMISRLRCRNGAHRPRDSLLHPPHSQSSEVCRSTSGSVQDSGQYEALLQESQHHHHHHHHLHQQRQLPVPSVAVPSAPCTTVHHQLLEHTPSQQMREDTRSSPHHLPGSPHLPASGSHLHMGQEVSPHHHQGWDHQLSPPSSRIQSEVSVPHNHRATRSSTQQHRQQQQLHPHRHRKQGSKVVSRDELYPPHIQVSRDGEEGYARAQRALHSKQQLDRNWQTENEVFRPPPNKTIFDRDSPPPPYSLNPPGVKSLDSLVPPVGVNVLRPDRSSLTPQDSPTGVPRSHSMSLHH